MEYDNCGGTNQRFWTLWWTCLLRARCFIVAILNEIFLVFNLILEEIFYVSHFFAFLTSYRSSDWWHWLLRYRLTWTRTGHKENTGRVRRYFSTSNGPHRRVSWSVQSTHCHTIWRPSLFNRNVFIWQGRHPVLHLWKICNKCFLYSRLHAWQRNQFCSQILNTFYPCLLPKTMNYIIYSNRKLQ